MSGITKDMTGFKVGKLTVIGEVLSFGHGAVWSCRCDCGTIVEVRGNHLRKRNPTRSCGCLNKGGMTHGKTVGYSMSPAYRSWMAMRQRCNNPKNISYSNYGGRGIKVCERWEEFEIFLSDMRERPDGHTLERIDVNSGYNPQNCRWANYKDQGRNRRNNCMITFRGQTRTATEWAEKIGIARHLIYHRLKKKWSIEQALLIKPEDGIRINLKFPVTFRGQTKNLEGWSKETGIPYCTLYNRIKKSGWSIEKTLTTPKMKVR